MTPKQRGSEFSTTSLLESPERSGSLSCGSFGVAVLPLLVASTITTVILTTPTASAVTEAPASTE